MAWTYPTLQPTCYAISLAICHPIPHPVLWSQLTRDSRPRTAVTMATTITRRVEIGGVGGSKLPYGQVQITALGTVRYVQEVKKGNGGIYFAYPVDSHTLNAPFALEHKLNITNCAGQWFLKDHEIDLDIGNDYMVDLSKLNQLSASDGAHLPRVQSPPLHATTTRHHYTPPPHASTTRRRHTHPEWSISSTLKASLRTLGASSLVTSRPFSLSSAACAILLSRLRFQTNQIDITTETTVHLLIHMLVHIRANK